MKEKLKKLYSVTFKLSFQSLCGITDSSSARSVVPSKDVPYGKQNYRRVYGCNAPKTKTIKACFEKFLTMGSVFSLELCVGVLPKRKSKKFAVRSREAQ
jgi:hypothetical protein